MGLALDIPPHLRSLVVEQCYERYTSQDHAVWRFVVLQTHARLLRTAHPAYAAGFVDAGIEVDRIPRIEAMSDRLSRVGWSAVCVDGFIPPRAFQAFQAAGVLPIAADIRRSEHLTYTPAPDIIHEAAGHAPFLSDPTYARYLRRIGDVGRRAFGHPADRDVYEAIFALSEIKEDPASTPEQLKHAELAFERASQSVGGASEAARVARLYWWTVEYGLLGTPERHGLYGAGLLSSIGEGYFCENPSVRKLRLDASCIDVAYDITRAQPQLYVAESFEQLESVLDDVASGLSQRRGDRAAFETARQSAEVATITLDSGAQVTGTVRDVRCADQGTHEVVLVELHGRCALAFEDAVRGEWPTCERYLLPLGTLDDGTALSALDYDALRRRASDRGELRLTLRGGVHVSGTLGDRVERGGRLLFVVLHDVVIAQHGRERLRVRGPYAWAIGSAAVSVAAGAPAGHEPPTEPTGMAVPKERSWSASERELIALYDRALATFETLRGEDLPLACEPLVRALDAAFPDEWLLRWNLLESLIKADEGRALQRRLERELERLELRYEGREPIATGLAYLRELTHEMPLPGWVEEDET